MSFTAGAGTRFLVSTGASGTTPLSGPLSITGGTATANAPVLNATQTWNNAAVTFTGWQLNVTDTASNAASLLMDLQVGGSSRFSVSKAGSVTSLGGFFVGAFAANSTGNRISVGGTFCVSETGAQGPIIYSAGYLGWTSGGASINSPTADLTLFRDAANTLAQRNGVNAQTLRVYNTFTDASNYERGRFAWVSNVLTIGTENAGTGLSRGIAFQAGGVTYLSISDIGVITANSSAITYGIGRSIVMSQTNGQIRLTNNTQNGFDILVFGAGSASFPALKINGASLQTKLADDSAFAPHAMQYLDITDGIAAPASAAGRARIYVDTADGDLKVIFGDGTVKTIVTD